MEHNEKNEKTKFFQNPEDIQLFLDDAVLEWLVRRNSDDTTKTAITKFILNLIQDNDFEALILKFKTIKIIKTLEIFCISWESENVAKAIIENVLRYVLSKNECLEDGIAIWIMITMAIIVECERKTKEILKRTYSEFEQGFLDFLDCKPEWIGKVIQQAKEECLYNRRRVHSCGSSLAFFQGKPREKEKARKKYESSPNECMGQSSNDMDRR